MAGRRLRRLGRRPSAGSARSCGVTYEPVGGLNPRGGPAACARAARTGSPDSSTRSSGARPATPTSASGGGGLFRGGDVLPGAVLAKAHMPDLAAVMPVFNVESLEGAGDAVESRVSRHRVEFESIDFNRRLHRDGPARVRPDRAARDVQPRVPRLGRRDRGRGRLRRLRAPALLQLAPARAERGRVRGGARERRPALPPDPDGDGRARDPHLSTPAPGTRASSRSPRPRRRGGT